MDLREIADRLAIQELIARYCHALDLQDWPSFHALFTDDAVLDYTAYGGPYGSPADVEAFLSPFLQSLTNAQHMTSTVIIDLMSEGNTARTRAAGIVPLTSRGESGGEQTAFTGLSYEDEMRRTPAGWRIATRRLVPGWAIAPLT